MKDNRWILVNPIIFQGRGFLPKEDCAFVIMPFVPKWSGIVYETIKTTLKELKFKCKRADEQYGHLVLEDIWQGISEASIVIADVTGRNPNVYYELGIAHVLGRRLILLTQDTSDIPFDTRNYRHVNYSFPWWPSARYREMNRLSDEIKKQIEWINENEILPSEGPFAEAYAKLRNIKI